MKEIFKSSFRNIFILSLFVYTVTAFFSEGYHHPDEHFQILEFSNYMIGKSPASDLPWEFGEKIRPALQPALASIIIKSANFIGIYNPFNYALILRMIAALLSWFLICKVSLLVVNNFKTDNGKKIFLYSSFFLWFIPFISVRFSSENFSAITFLGAIYIIIKSIDDILHKKILQLFFAGLLLGLSIFFRFQIVFAIAGLVLWLSLIKKTNWKKFFILIISGISAIVFCVFIDSWFYGKFEFTPFNYYIANIVEKKAAGWGTSPWWYYFKLFFIQGIPPISLLLLIFFFLGLIKNLKNIFTWCIIPFLLAHFIVGHKEMRFLFPMAFVFIYIASLGIDYLIAKHKYQRLWRFILILSLIINIPVLFIRMVIPAQEAISYYKFLYNYSNKKEITLLCNENNIYELVDNKVNFYKSKNVKCIVLHGDQEFSKYLTEHKPDSIFMFDTKLISENKFVGYKNESVFCLFPKWLLRFNINNWESRSRIWDIHKLKKI